jgi:hypothetical protein
MGEEADAKGGQPWRFDIRIVSLDDLPPDVEGVAVLWAKGEVRITNCADAPLRMHYSRALTVAQVRKSTPVCAAATGRAVFDIPPVLGLETVLKMNDGSRF